MESTQYTPPINADKYKGFERFMVCTQKFLHKKLGTHSESQERTINTGDLLGCVLCTFS